MCPAIKELIEDSKAEGIELTTKVYKHLQNYPDVTNDDLVATFECSIENIKKIRTALNI